VGEITEAHATAWDGDLAIPFVNEQAWLLTIATATIRYLGEASLAGQPTIGFAEREVSDPASVWRRGVVGHCSGGADWTEAR
jgi:hypothetical protein